MAALLHDLDGVIQITREDQPWPVVLPADWRELERRADGAAYLSSDRLRVICSVAREADGKRWLHVSLSRAHKVPFWADVRRVKDLFIGPDRKAIQVLPRAAEYVNIHPHTLHLFCCLEGDTLPDFTHGTGSL